MPDVQKAYALIFGQGLWTIGGSMVAFLIGQLVDVVIFHRIRRVTGERHVWLRATASTAVSQILDSFVVLYIAFVIGPQHWPVTQFLAVGTVNYLYKMVGRHRADSAAVPDAPGDRALSRAGYGARAARRSGALEADAARGTRHALLDAPMSHSERLRALRRRGRRDARYAGRHGHQRSLSRARNAGRARARGSRAARAGSARGRAAARARARRARCAARSRPGSGLDAFLREYHLGSREGVILMCLAEALLRIPDAETADRLIADKIPSGDWEDHLGDSDSLFVNASTWGLMLTGRIVDVDRAELGSVRSWFARLTSRIGEPVARAALRQAMRILGHQFVMGRTIEEALERADGARERAYRYSFDMLGESALTVARMRSGTSRSIARRSSRWARDAPRGQDIVGPSQHLGEALGAASALRARAARARDEGAGRRGCMRS